MPGPQNTINQADVLGIRVTLGAEGELCKTRWGDPIPATSVQWDARGGAKGLIVSVTAFASDHQNRTWMDPRFFVADGLNSNPPPEWVPPAPEWFWAAVGEMDR